MEKRSGLENIQNGNLEYFNDQVIGKEDAMYADLASQQCDVAYNENETSVTFIKAWEAKLALKQGKEDFKNELEQINKVSTEGDGDQVSKPKSKGNKELVRFRFKELAQHKAHEGLYQVRNPVGNLHTYISKKDIIDPSRCYDLKTAIFSEEL